MDGICQFLYEDEDPLPILTGYFLKVMEQLLDKQKLPTLEYLLLHQEGKIFSGLLRHLDHHSLATLLIKLIEQNIQPEKKERWTNDYEIDSDFESNEIELTPEQQKMQEVLKQKSVMVVESLISKLSAKNTDDLHNCLNASQVLSEFCDNETFFSIITETTVLRGIVNIVTSTDENAQNQPYALNFMSQIIEHMFQQENSFFKDSSKEETIDAFLKNHFVDLCYNSLMLLRGGENDKTYVNQSGLTVRRTGMLRIRAMENLRNLIHLLSKQSQQCVKMYLGDTLRKKIIETMLYMMRTYHQCSISHQQGLLVLNTIREAYDEDDLETMKSFVKTELDNDMNFYYPSGRTTSRMNLG